MTITARRDPESARRILTALPDWFGIPEAVEEYVNDVANDAFPCLVAERAGEVVGFALLHRHYPESAELHLIAVDPSWRGREIGRELVEAHARQLAADGGRYLVVHTVGPSFEHAGYAATRAFYRALGFCPLEERTGIDWPGPTQILVRAI
ncbi:ribosomal protein S18 acetylase RimI-like enzyme [Friedmanniella endophytica]|uniref:Ribosomal protein S18 acetylase RimI-like enzyme n=1 Tax=Microlunatus kandeliicorticis TaxID=1759536 RepID=A0A7W3IRN0_9ACTN|nr:GNAT family N-acetyltransferase [Microlunatus kandeliicorticis]MBA8794003.1 ribosomal protein S18 acetylase RimI-like enzyme [Microlunatus kandeliicorticis]